jgi:imidazole glycerol-phosphate synthase subunit HisF
MSKHIRIIPKLDIKGPNLVKGIQLEGLRVLGKPEYFAETYYRDGADELLYMDVVASLYQRNNLIEIVRRTAENIFIPLTVGGGIRSIADIRIILRAGADKVAINTAAINNPDIIREGAQTFGSQCIVVSIEAKKTSAGSYEAYTDNGRERTAVDAFEWAKHAVELGAGELLITSIDNEGTGKGYDTELLAQISRHVHVPVIACGGAGTMAHFEQAVLQGCADAVAAASVFHYDAVKGIDINEFDDEGNIEYIKKLTQTARQKFGRIETFSISQLKTYLTTRRINCRVLPS